MNCDTDECARFEKRFDDLNRGFGEVTTKVDLFGEAMNAMRESLTIALATDGPLGVVTERLAKVEERTHSAHEKIGEMKGMGNIRDAVEAIIREAASEAKETTAPAADSSSSSRRKNGRASIVNGVISLRKWHLIVLVTGVLLLGAASGKAGVEWCVSMAKGVVGIFGG